MTKQWYRLKKHEQPSECDIICRSLTEEKVKKRTNGQLLLRMVRHRDSGGREAQLRTSQGIRELSEAKAQLRTFTSKNDTKDSLSQKMLAARQQKMLAEKKMQDPEMAWKAIKKKFLKKHAHRRNEVAENGFQSIMLGFGKKSKKNNNNNNNNSVVEEKEETTRNATTSSPGVGVDGGEPSFICSSKVCEVADSIVGQSNKLLALGEQMLSKLAAESGAGSAE